jgi:hypothetical protein
MRNTIDGYIIYVKSMYMTKHSNLEKETVEISIKIIYHGITTTFAIRYKTM